MNNFDQIFTSVVKRSAVVRSREDGDQLSLGEEFVAVLDHLVGPADQIEVVLLEELLDDLWAERKAHSPAALVPGLYVFVWIGPEEITEDSCLRDLDWPVDVQDLAEVIELGAEASVHAEDLVGDQSADWKAVEAVAKASP